MSSYNNCLVSIFGDLDQMIPDTENIQIVYIFIHNHISNFILFSFYSFFHFTISFYFDWKIKNLIKN